MKIQLVTPDETKVLSTYSKQFEECVRKWCKETVNVTDLGYINSVQKIMVFNEEALL